MKTQSFSPYLLSLALALAATACTTPAEKPVEGKVKRESLSFAPKVTGRILTILVQEGDLVKRGDTLAILDVPEVNAKLAQARGVVKAAQAQRTLSRNGATENQLKQLSAKQHGLQEQYTFAQKSLERAKAMFEDSMMTPQAYDEIYAKYQGAKAQLDAVNAELNEARKGVRSETQTATQGQADQALGVLQEAEIAYSERYIIATNDMEIETVSLREGELATAGYSLFSGYRPQSTYFRFTIPESRIGKFEKGAEITVHVPYNKSEVKGKILTIKQLNKYADVTAAYPDYQIEDALYELKIIPAEPAAAAKLLTNATATL
ncbi:biotin/lipoyl-binding protein [Ravibacter arvi]|uniref:Biotin/lipoyl-binding protein n=1 Tax=Ravibacter arvi TaxID=2051041 RepID=A0ABP8M3P9_9BACT